MARVTTGGGSETLQHARTPPAIVPGEAVAGSGSRRWTVASPFLELSPLAGIRIYRIRSAPADGDRTGTVGRVECMIVANDPTVKGGVVGPTSVTRDSGLMDIARENRLPLINLTEVGGADLPKQAVFVPGGASFRNLTQLSAAGIPDDHDRVRQQHASGAYVPGMSDYVVMQRRRPKVFFWAARRW